MEEPEAGKIRVMSAGTRKFDCFAVCMECFGNVLANVAVAHKKCRVIIEYDPAEDGSTRVFIEDEEVQP